MKRIFLIGAGYVGSELASQLVEQGFQVTIAKRNIKTGLTPALGETCHIVRLDVSSKISDQAHSALELMHEADCVVYCVSADSFTEPAYEMAYIQGLENVLGALTQSPVQSRYKKKRRVVFVSSTGVFGQANGQKVDESSPTDPESFSGRTMLQAERVLRDWAHENPEQNSGVAIRFSGIYGPGRTRMITEILDRKPVTALRWVQMTNRIHRDDCARVIIHVIKSSSPLPVYVASDPTPTTFGDLAMWLAAQCNQQPPTIDPNAPRSAALERGGNKVVWSTALLAEGFVFSVPSYREGYGPLLKDVLAGLAEHRNQSERLGS